MQTFAINIKKNSKFYFLVENRAQKIYAYSKYCALFS